MECPNHFYIMLFYKAKQKRVVNPISVKIMEMYDIRIKAFQPTNDTYRIKDIPQPMGI